MTLTLDLEALGNNDGHVLIPTFPGNGQPYSVTLGWLSTTPSGDISLTLPPLNVSNPGSEQAKFVIPNAHLKSIAGGSAAVRYTLVQNGVPANRESETTNVTITSLPVRLTAPLVVEANGTLVLDLAQISGSAVTVLIVAWVGQRAGDRVILTWAGTPQVFNPETPFAPVDYTDEYVVQPGGEQNPITFSVPLAYLTPLGGGTLQLSYQVFKASGSSQTSPVTEYSVTAAALVFPAPLIPEAPAGTLKPMDVLAGATFRATYLGMQTSDTIVPEWNDISSVIPWRLGEADGTVESSVPANMIGAVIGKTIDVRYQVKRNGQGYWSDVLKLTVEAIPLASLPTPQITQASGGILDVGALQGDADLTVQPWPFIAAGQRMWMRLEGSSNLVLPAWQEYAITTTNAQTTKVPLTFLQGLADASQLRLVLEVSFDDGVTRRAFPVSELTVKNVPKPAELFEDFASYPFLHMTSNTPHKFIGMTATSVNAVVSNDYMNGMLRHSLHTVGVMPLGVRLTLTFDRPCTNISFIDELNAYEYGYKNWRITIFDTEGNQIQSWIPDSRTQRNITHPLIARLEARSLANNDMDVSFNDFKMTFS